MDFALSEETPGWSLKRLLGPAAGEKLAALAWNRDLREIKPHRRARSAGAQPAIGRKPAEERVFRPTLLHLSDFKMNPAAPAARLECPVGRRTVPSIRSAIASDGMLLATAR